jgi:hypothetical protein
MGAVSMSWLRTVLVLAIAFLAVFWESAFNGLRHLLGAQVELLPALMVYTALCTDLVTVTLLAILGGLWFDSLSANPLGVSMLPLFIVGLIIHVKRDLMVRNQTFPQATLGLAASAIVPLLTVLVLLTKRQTPLLGWGSLWQLIVMSLGGAVVTPICFELFGWLDRTLVHPRAEQSSFRPDREIRRGR